MDQLRLIKHAGEFLHALHRLFRVAAAVAVLLVVPEEVLVPRQRFLQHRHAAVVVVLLRQPNLRAVADPIIRGRNRVLEQ